LTPAAAKKEKVFFTIEEKDSSFSLEVAIGLLD